MINHANTEKGKTGSRRASYPEGLVPHNNANSTSAPQMQTLPEEGKGGYTVPGNKTHISDHGAKKLYTVLFQKETETQRSNNLPAATLMRSKRARIRTHSIKTPNPMLPFSMEPLLNSSRTVLKS